MHYTPTHKSMPRPQVVGASRDARWAGIPFFSRMRAAKVQGLDRVAVMRYQRRKRDSGRGA